MLDSPMEQDDKKISYHEGDAENVGLENAGLENAGPDLQGWKTRDNRLWNAKCLLMHKMQFQITYLIGQALPICSR